MPNQDLFDLELATARMGNGATSCCTPTTTTSSTVESDHSLNVGVEQAQGLIERGWKLVFAHEHQQRTALDGNVVIIGNQIPTSVADCLGNDSKQFATIRLVTCRHTSRWTSRPCSTKCRGSQWMTRLMMHCSSASSGRPRWIRQPTPSARSQACANVIAPMS